MLRFEYDAVVAFHPYRTFQPWDHGGVRLLHVDAVNGETTQLATVRKEIEALKLSLVEECNREDISAFLDNHMGITVRTDRPFCGEGPPEPTFYQLRFSDGSVYLWLMPGAPS